MCVRELNILNIGRCLTVCLSLFHSPVILYFGKDDFGIWKKHSHADSGISSLSYLMYKQDNFDFKKNLLVF